VNEENRQVQGFVHPPITKWLEYYTLIPNISEEINPDLINTAPWFTQSAVIRNNNSGF